jgi:ribosomal protein RSM22 (predicted rRNA methylase)
LVHFAFACAPAEFEKLAFLYANASSQENSLRQMAGSWSPRTIVDVSTYKGDWSRMANSIWPNANIIMIEPNMQHNAHLRTVACELYTTLHCDLHGAVDEKEVQLHIKASESSVLSERSDVSRKTEFRRLTTLNSLLAVAQF